MSVYWVGNVFIVRWCCLLIEGGLVQILVRPVCARRAGSSSSFCFATYCYLIYIDVGVVCWFIGSEVSSSYVVHEPVQMPK
jgi:hypothetical protein